MIITKWIKTNDKFFVVPILISFSSTLFILLNYLVILPILPNRIPMHYSRPWGETQLVENWQFLLLPVTLVVLTLLNLFLASQLHPSQLVLRRTLLLTVVLLSFMILVSSIKILLIFV
ncbi:hypothetical protein A3H85_03745 [Candidatus Daviesbacteria bacterium RIFCSPLOWO2_02_FULL_40_8]|uniref:DUF1648 domain-containing protein n=1 Tax=Candidatus Daviesbacteria bacterium RIFCSPLOWO2_01_FULL_40_24 TaxID=1797787 RepID=A0A1F5MKA6_9BACT|nr:MAG: hypothetical protein A2780_00820 [Candidatus Daviesbacteria bacterium RIFCSPHIGHO2_01_FULL_41_45]OGE34042.1 MAG: hypothetical protein A3C32_00700 [Candidatus Daviesbacteria bacterium RIFCSPHIGHO2_02_FULL_41_14]OGE65778.1 MAG: hypothetical protein A3B49_04135 [Candidatus Daviesbacteria bacterium RIFCSPLOWO2_01_FULL_40_24]OGE66513.1 MAG: hypothetical protein A3H85_03745 [Candidatus Daviesbacteria bacterium RIFCSPLOWO2_02_FULL_40_8]